MKAFQVLAPAIIVAAAVGGFAIAQSMPASVKVTSGILTDAKGMTLYTWDKDKEANKSACEGNCIMNWPALKAGAADKDVGDWKVISRSDGSKQLAYKGKPLYYFAMDKAPGDQVGEGKGMVWHVAKP
jgi:predicted lipoprotein with Yx(FWY)xxD motif